MEYLNSKTECARCLGCTKPLCREFCPIQNDIPRVLQYVKSGQYRQAVELIGHPFGEICGYICPSELQCRGGCVLSKRNDAIRIDEVERMIFAEAPFEFKRKGKSLQDVKVAVVGGGVAGISFASAVYAEGARVVIYEKDELLSTLKIIPYFRLPREAIRRVEDSLLGKIDVIRKCVRQSEIDDLRAENDIVYIACGRDVHYSLGVQGDELAVGYAECLQSEWHGKVIIIGGGNTAIDCARWVKRQGCEAIVAYRRTEKDMPAFNSEIQDAKNEGVSFLFNCAPTSLCKNGDELVLTVARTASQGRDKLEITSDTVDLSCDCVVSAIGSAFNDELLGRAYKIDDNGHLFDNVYIGGDAKGGSLVSHAVADALLTAKSIIKNR